MTVYAPPGAEGSVASYESRYDNWIGGKRVAPVKGQYFENISPVNGKPFCEIARSTAEDIELALDAAHAAARAWGKTSVTERADILLKIAQRMEDNLEALAVIETWENGKPVRETLAADIPLAIDHFKYFAGVLRAQEGTLGELDEDTVAYHFHEPLGVVGQIIPWNFPILMAVWKLAPALAAGNCVVLKPAEQTPASIMWLIDLVGDLLPAGVLNIVNGFGIEAGKPLASSNRIRKIAFTGETTTGRLIMQYASANIIPVTLELGGKSPNIFFDDIAQHDDEFYDKALEGFTMFALNQGEVCTCPSRALIQESIYDKFLSDATERTKKVLQGNPLDSDTMIGAQASNDQLEKILSYIQIGKYEGARLVCGGERVVESTMKRFIAAFVPADHHAQRLTHGVRGIDGRCVLCELVGDHDSPFLVERGAHYAIVAHPLPRIGGALLVTPLEHDTVVDDEVPADLAIRLHRALMALPDDAAMNMWLVADEANDAHWYFELQPRTANLAGVEVALGLNVVARDPLVAAAEARERLAAPAQC